MISFMISFIAWLLVSLIFSVVLKLTKISVGWREAIYGSLFGSGVTILMYEIIKWII